VSTTSLSELVSRVAEGAAPLWERLGDAYQPRDSARGAALARQRLERWRDKAAGGNHRQFEQRLSWLGTTMERVLPRLGDVRLVGREPAWLPTFDRAMRAHADAALLAIAERAPFGHLIAPFARVAVSALGPACAGAFTEEALSALQADLVQRLVHVASPTWYVAFSSFRTARLAGAPPEPDSDSLYREFVSRQLDGGLPGFFEEHAALARLLAHVSDMWARNVDELAAAHHADAHALEQRFPGGGRLGRICGVEASRSDAHNGQRAVMRVRFENALELYFKPRDLGIEAAWYALLDDLNHRGAELRSFRVVARGEHGWVEPAVPGPCRDAEEAARYYRRAGQLLCVLYALEASDCLYENVVAHGGHPVLVDHETLMHHVLRRHAALTPADEVADDILFNSVLRAGFLPSWEPGPDGTCVDISGLGAMPGQITPYQRRRWQHVNTDAVTLTHERIVIDSDDHLPKLDGRVLRPIDHTEPLVDGFRDMYRRLLRHGSELVAPGGAVASLGDQRIRLVFHPTRIYGVLLKRLYSPRQMRCGVDRSIEMDIMSRFYLEYPDKAAFTPILHAELMALEGLDVPYFSLPADHRSLHLPTGQVIDDMFEETAIERVRKRLAQLDPNDMEMQVGFIRAAANMSAHAVEHGRDPEPGPARGQDTATWSRDALAGEALAIAERIAERAIVSPGGQTTWVAPQLLPQTGRQHLRPLRMDLYNGIGGVALLFSAVARVGGARRDMALAALSSMQAFVAAADRETLVQQGYTLGAATGLGAILYTLSRCATLLDEPGLLATAEAVIDLFDPSWIARDTTFDVMAGSAGAILALATYARVARSDRARALAVACGEHLLAQQRATAHGGASWPSRNGLFLTGLSHGAAGIALALLRLFSLTGDARFRDAALAAMAFEDAVYDHAHGNWPDFRHARPGQPAFMETWCHGAPGIGLARAASLSVLDTAETRRGIDAAIAVVRRVGAGGRDGLCCGNAGRIELLVTAARACADPELLALATHQLSAVVERARGRGYRFTGQGAHDLFDPSLFQGLSGIGYQILRVIEPDIISSVLTWE
jgi:type 2 lantibiotic biosynthesis protein LanM